MFISYNVLIIALHPLFMRFGLLLLFPVICVLYFRWATLFSFRSWVQRKMINGQSTTRGRLTLILINFIFVSLHVIYDISGFAFFCGALNCTQFIITSLVGSFAYVSYRVIDVFNFCTQIFVW